MGDIEQVKFDDGGRAKYTNSFSHLSGAGFPYAPSQEQSLLSTPVGNQNMAVRDRNMFVWQAYVIASTIVSLILLVGMFFLWRAWSDTSRNLAGKNEQLTTVTQNGQQAIEKVNILLDMLGRGQLTEKDRQDKQSVVKDDPELGPVIAEFNRMLTLFPANTADKEKNLMKLPQTLLEIIRVRNEEVAEGRTRMNSLQAQMTKEVEDHRRARETAELAQQKAEKDLADTRVAHKEQIQTVNKIKDEAIEKMEKNKAFFDGQLQTLATQVKKLESESSEKSQAIANQVERIQRFENPDYASSQGRVTQVREGGTVAWINLGTKHGLRKGVMFSILDASETQISKATPKARMIIQDVSDDFASGEVYFGADYESKNKYYQRPVVEGDQIYSPVWRPGRKTSFALVGKMDINGDFQDDMEELRRIIEAAGGVIDAELPARGQEKGGIKNSTNYLVIGSDVENIANSPNGADKAKEYSRFIAKGKSFGLQEWSVDKLMGFLKVDESSRIVPLGNRMQASDFKIRNQVSPQVSDGKVSEIFSQGKKSP